MSFDMTPQVHRLVNALVNMRQTRKENSESSGSLEKPKDADPQAPDSEIDHLNLRASRVIAALENPQNLSTEDLVFGIKFGLDTLMEWHEEWARLVGGSKNGGTRVTATRASSRAASVVPSAPPPRSTGAPTIHASAAPTRSTRRTRTTNEVDHSAAASTQAHSVMAAGPTLVAPRGDFAPRSFVPVSSTPLVSASVPAPAPATAPMPIPKFATTHTVLTWPDVEPPVRRKRGRPRKYPITAALAPPAAKTPAKVTAGSSKGKAKDRVEKAKKTPPAAGRKGRGTGTGKEKKVKAESAAEETDIEVETEEED